MFALIPRRGLRPGEAVGPLDVGTDLDIGSIAIGQQITTLGYTPITKEVKSDAGDRTGALDSSILAIQKAYRARRAA
jgi:hypothetical protein